MSTDPKQELVEGLCGVMHDAYEAAAAQAGWETQERSRKPWEDVPEANKVTMRAAVSAALDALTFMGWVSPEEATAREAAARREALLGAREDLVAELVCCDVYERLSGKSTTARTPEERNEYQHHSICYWGGASAELVRALAEPERDEEGGND